jgi:uncharacterized membrane protein YvbJ
MKKILCLQCGKEDPFVDEQCSSCGAALPEANPVVQPRLAEDEFAELDYRPKSKKGLIIPLAIIAVVVLFSIIGVLALTNDAPVAQGIEQRTSNPLAEGSNPSRRTMLITVQDKTPFLVAKRWR